MKIVIDISEQEFKALKEDMADPSWNFYHSIKQAIIIPKGHGRLGDLDALHNDLRERQRSYEYTSGIRRPINEAVRDGITMSIFHIDNAPTIIEADKEEK